MRWLEPRSRAVNSDGDALDNARGAAVSLRSTRSPGDRYGDRRAPSPDASVLAELVLLGWRHDDALVL
jgi:hypothetical protein